MRCRVHSLFLGIIIFFTAGNIYAQKKLVVMGSSTAAGTGASTYANSWVGRLNAYYHQNTSDNLDTIVTNIAIGGYNSYNELQSGLAPVPSRPYPPDSARNVDKALSFSPDVIIINLPTNDIASTYTKTEYMYNLRQMYSKIIAANVRCYITTTQPRNLPVAQRQYLKDLVDSIKTVFGIYSIDFWTDIVTGGDTNQIRYAVSAGDSIHVNDLGHNYLFIRVRDKQVFPSGGPLPLTLTDFNVKLKNQTVIVGWRSEMEEPNSWYEIQRSSGAGFSTLYRQAATGRSAPATYSWTDQHPVDGQSFYRLKITEPSKESYSKTISILNKAPELYISSIYSGLSELTTEIRIQKSQPVVFSIINALGAIVDQRTILVNGPSGKVTLQTGKLASGQYILRIQSSDNNSSMKVFNKL
ncbi:MAG: SGNH/GDSL hydrolase family protein [Ferruginibacter sp.]